MKYVVVGGTGTLGKALIPQLLKNGATHVVCLSRDELKQKQLKAEIGDPRLKFLVGDIKDRSSLIRAFEGADSIFHVAALKHIDVVEENPIEGVKTNILGTANIAEAAMDAYVPYVAFSSTDKAVEPINVYGMTKAISERYIFDLNARQQTTRFSVFRWGNVLGSRGSVIHHFVKTLRERGEVDITHPDMTRFWIHIDEATKFMLAHYRNAPRDQPCIPPMKASAVVSLAEAIATAMGLQTMGTKFVGMRQGEKLSECILSDGKQRITSDNCEAYSYDELMSLIRPVLEGINS